MGSKAVQEGKMMDKTINKEYAKFVLLISVGIFLRFVVMSLGHNFDWESYCVVGEISGNLRNVYAETSRYNYGMIFFCIQGLLYRVSQIKPDSYEIIYRVLMVTTLTLADLGITYYIAKKFSLRKALIFFLNPISIIITGYHNQFDNIAILLALLTLVFYNEEDKFNKRDVGFVLTFALCLMTKHMLFMLPAFLLLKNGLNWKKKIVYSCFPPFLFLLSFVPFVIGNEAALQGIINNVFLYRSFNNAPLFILVYNLIDFPAGLRIFVYMGMMILTAFITRKFNYETQLLLYLIAMVAFSSAIANQYLVIPMVALCVFDLKWFRNTYMVIMGAHLVLHIDGFGALSRIQEFMPELIGKLLGYFVSGSYILAAWILFWALIYELFLDKCHLDKVFPDENSMSHFTNL